MTVKTEMLLFIIGIFVSILIILSFAWGGSFAIGAIGVGILLLPYLLIVFTSLSKLVIKLTHRREPSNDKMFNALLIAVSFYYGAARIAAHMATLFLLIVRLFFSLIAYIVSHRWEITYITFYLSELPLKIASILTTPIQAILVWFIKRINYASIPQNYEP